MSGDRHYPGLRFKIELGPPPKIEPETAEALRVAITRRLKLATPCSQSDARQLVSEEMERLGIELTRSVRVVTDGH